MLAKQSLPENILVMRILHIEWSDDMGGQEKRVLSEAAGLSARGHYVAIVCREHAKIRNEATKKGIDVHTLPLRKPYDILSITRLAKFLKTEGFDVVNTHSGIDSWIGGLAARLAGVPVLVRTRHLNIPLKRNILNFIHYLPDMYITSGENMQRTLVEQCSFPAERVISIPTGVPPEFFDVKKDAGMKKKYGLREEEIVITNVGILRKVKGHEITLQAVRPVVDKFPQARFLLVGDGPRRKLLQQMADNMGIAEYVRFTGHVANIYEIYSFADVAILSSWSEGVPQSILQAMAFGVPVVATKVGGVPEVVMSGKTGILVSPGEYAELAGGILRLLTEPSLASVLAGNAGRLVRERHSLGHMLDKTEDLYIKLLREKKKGKDNG